MSGKVFISCGQASPEEKSTAADLSHWLRDRGFTPYVAIHAQSIQDVNTAIIAELKASDYYIFIDFPREVLADDPGRKRRGSLFTHQELAIAYILGFEKVLFLKHKDVKREGQEAVEKAKQAVNERNWTPTYTRHLIASHLRWSDSMQRYTSHNTGEVFIGKFLYIDIENRRSDLAAFNTVARLSSISDIDGQNIAVADLSHLKITGQPGYSQTIWPNSHGAFDLLLTTSEEGGAIFLNSSLDVTPKPAIITMQGRYVLRYEVLSECFPVLVFSIEIDVTGYAQTTQARLL
jgi:hypothetical protein